MPSSGPCSTTVGDVGLRHIASVRCVAINRRYPRQSGLGCLFSGMFMPAPDLIQGDQATLAGPRRLSGRYGVGVS
jgi:hypothetical protein